MHRLSAREFRRTRSARATGGVAAALTIAALGVALALAPALAPSARAVTPSPTSTPTAPTSPTPTSPTPTAPTPTAPRSTAPSSAAATLDGPETNGDGANDPLGATSNGTHPAVTSPAAGSFIGSNYATVSGTRAPGDEIQLFVGDNGGDPACIVAAGGDATWSCADVALPNGPAVVLRAVVTADSSLSATTSVAVLGPPEIRSDAGSVLSNGLVHGTAFPGALVTVRIAGAQVAGAGCSVTADAGGSWACVLDPRLANGRYSISASQVGPSAFGDRESDNSAPLTLVFDAVAPAAPT
ncbi:MAG: hypothetical protein ABI310_06520, partial [Microbacteriaceae bacterium]